MVLILFEFLQKHLLGDLSTHAACDWSTQMDIVALGVKQSPKQKSTTECRSYTNDKEKASKDDEVIPIRGKT